MLKIHFNMKKFRVIGCIVTAMCLCLGMASCSEDDDNATGNNGVAKLGNNTFNVPFGFWHTGDEDSDSKVDDNLVMLEFYSFDSLSNNFPGSVSVVSIEYELPEGQKEITSTVLKGDEYEFYVAHGVTMSSSGIQCESIRSDSGNPDLKIVRNGNTYSISIKNLKVYAGDTADDISYNFSFDYNGQLTHRQIAE